MAAYICICSTVHKGENDCKAERLQPYMATLEALGVISVALVRCSFAAAGCMRHPAAAPVRIPRTRTHGSDSAAAEGAPR